MNWRGIRAVMSKDLRVVFRSKMVMLPMIILPLILQVLMPIGFGLSMILMPDSALSTTNMQDFNTMLSIMPEAVRSTLVVLDPRTMLFILMTVYAFAPMYLIVPMMTASVIAADSFVGERERKTMEALLYTPLTNIELLLAKMLGAFSAALAVGIGSFLIYVVVLNGVGWPLMGRIFFPNWMWIALVLWVGPAVAGLGLGTTVLISTRVSTFQEAYQLGAIVVVPVVALMLGQMAGVLYMSVALALGLGAVLWIIDAVIVWFGVKTFDRDALLARL